MPDRGELIAHGRRRPPAQSENMARGELQSHHTVPRYPLAIAWRQNGPVLDRLSELGWSIHTTTSLQLNPVKEW